MYKEGGRKLGRGKEGGRKFRRGGGKEGWSGSRRETLTFHRHI